MHNSHQKALIALNILFRRIRRDLNFRYRMQFPSLVRHNTSTPVFSSGHRWPQSSVCPVDTTHLRYCASVYCEFHCTGLTCKASLSAEAVRLSTCRGDSVPTCLIASLPTSHPERRHSAQLTQSYGCGALTACACLTSLLSHKLSRLFALYIRSRAPGNRST